MKVELIEYTKDGINLIARLAKSTRMNYLEKLPDKKYIDCGIISSVPVNEEYIDWQRRNETFVKHLLKVRHLGILEHIVFTFHISEISRCLTHQLVRHRMASYLQQSDRHVKPITSDYVIPHTIYEDDDIFSEYTFMMKDAYNNYERLIRYGVPIEDARYVLPPAYYTQISVTMNCREILHFLELRLAKEAQLEIRQLACKIFDLCYEKYPLLFESLKELRDKND